MTADAQGRIIVDLFTTLDGVAQAPGGPEEDTEGGFAFGGWQAPLIDEIAGASIAAGMAHMDALLLGRRTYDIFAGYWPHQITGPDSTIALLFDRLPKYVASRTDFAPEWNGTTRIGSDLATEIADLRARHRFVHVIGSVDFVQTLLAEGLFDELTLWVHPILLGAGKNVFQDAVAPANLRLLADPIVSRTGVVQLRYERLEGIPAVGDMSSRD